MLRLVPDQEFRPRNPIILADMLGRDDAILEIAINRGAREAQKRHDLARE